MGRPKATIRGIAALALSLGAGSVAIAVADGVAGGVTRAPAAEEIPTGADSGPGCMFWLAGE